MKHILPISGFTHRGEIIQEEGRFFFSEGLQLPGMISLFELITSTNPATQYDLLSVSLWQLCKQGWSWQIFQSFPQKDLWSVKFSILSPSELYLLPSKGAGSGSFRNADPTSWKDFTIVIVTVLSSVNYSKAILCVKKSQNDGTRDRFIIVILSECALYILHQ